MTSTRETASLEKAIDKLERAHENAMRAMRYDENPYEHIRRAKMQASTAVWRLERILEGEDPDARDEGVLTLEGKTMDVLQRQIVTWAIRRHGGKAQAARALGVHRRTLQRWRCRKGE